VGSSDEEARKRRAEELREEIASIERGDQPEDDAGRDEPESPRDFIERKMREEDARQKKAEE
jgi:hypothetical protein